MTECCYEEWKVSDVRQILVGSILLSTVLGGSAATLGRYSGAVVIGRPLDIRVQVIADTSEDLGAQCVQAEVFFGDNPLGGASVRTSTQRNALDAEASVRVQTTVPVNEPIVSVVVRTGCSTPFARRYVMLADPMSEPATVSLPHTEPWPVVPAPAASHPLPVAAAGTPAARSKPVSAVRRKPAPAKDATPRLQLDPVEISPALERDPGLKLSYSLLSEPTHNARERAATVPLWKALNASPEDILHDAHRLSVLEAEIKALRDQAARSTAALQDLQAQVDQRRYMTWLAYALGGLLAASLASLYWLWKHKSTASGAVATDWWTMGVTKAAPAPEVATVKSKRKSKIRSKKLDLDLDLDLGGESGMDALHVDARESGVAPLSMADRRDFPSSHIGGSRSVATEELFDVQQQSDFFVSLGEFEQAIGVLKTHISESQETSALAYLDLFKLYHRLGRRDEYEQLRAEFNPRFNAGAPPFEAYKEGGGRGLESYEAAFSRIQALWPQPRVLDVIENSIFRDAADPSVEVFDLEAYQELLLLHAMAKDMIKRDAAGGSSDFQHTSIRPLKASGVRGAAITQPMDPIPHASPWLGLDVDLDALQEACAFEASLPDVARPVEPTAKTTPPPAGPAAEGVSVRHLIDFEVQDFVSSEEIAGKSNKVA